MASATTLDDCKKTLYDDLLSLLSSTCVIRVVLSVSYLLVSYFVMNFLRRIFSVCQSFRSMCQSSRMKDFKGALKLKIKVLGAHRIAMLQFCDRLRRGYKLSFMSPNWEKKSPLWEILSKDVLNIRLLSFSKV